MIMPIVLDLSVTGVTIAEVLGNLAIQRDVLLQRLLKEHLTAVLPIPSPTMIEAYNLFHGTQTLTFVAS